MIARAGILYFKKRLKALQGCRNSLNAGKSLFLDGARTQPRVDPDACETEFRTSKRIQKAGERARSLIAKPGDARCTDALLGKLGLLCATTVDAFVNPNGDGGCLLTGLAETVATLIDAQY